MREGRRLPVLVRLALRLFPRAFREAFGADIEAAYRDGESDRSGVWSRIGFMVVTSVDLIRSGMRERRSPTTGPEAGAVREGSGSGAVSSAHGGGSAWVALGDRLVGDARYAMRSLLKRPGFSVVAVLTLSLGIGANTAVFSAVDAVLLRELPYVDPDGLVLVYVADRESPDGRGVMSLPDIWDSGALPAFSTLIGFRPAEVTVTSGQEPEVVTQGRVTDGILRTFGLAPLMGRDIDEADNAQGASPVAVIGYRFWQDRLGGSGDVIGSTVELSDRTWEVVGVAPAGFAFPDDARIWTPRRLETDSCGRGCHTLLAIGRLSPDVTVESAQAQLTALASRLADEYPESNFEKGFRVVRLSDDRVADVRSGLWFVFGAAAVVLLIACANVANLLIVRGEGRRGEIALRSALGASRGRLAGQTMVESLVLAMAGVAGGLIIGRTSLLLLRSVPAGTLPGIEAVSLDGRVLAFTLALGVVVALGFGVSPAFRMTEGTSLRSLGSRRSHGDRNVRRTRSALLVVEVALSVLLLAGAGLLFRSFDNLYRTDLGFEPDDLMRFRLVLPTTRYETLPAITAFFERLEDRLASAPGVESVGSTFGPPLGRGHMTGDVTLDGRPEPEPGDETSASIHSATPGHLRTHRLPLLGGRWIEASDRLETTPVAVVSETFAQQNFPGQDPIGKRFRAGASFGWVSAPTWTIVGVVGDVPRSLTTAAEGDIYVPLAQYGPETMTVTIRSRAGVVPIRTLKDIVHELDPALPLRSVGTVRDAVDEQVAPTRFYLLSVAAFASLALLLACIGLYGVVAWLVARRTSEIGIRVALGARTRQVIQLVLTQGLRPAMTGVAIGIVLILALGSVAESVLFGVSARDPLMLAGVTALILVVVFAAVLVPALRASRIDPITALRAE